MTKRMIYTLLSLLAMSISLNLFQYSTTEIICKNIDSSWKADLLYKMGHHRLDGDKDWVPCDDLHPNHNE